MMNPSLRFIVSLLVAITIVASVVAADDDELETIEVLLPSVVSLEDPHSPITSSGSPMMAPTMAPTTPRLRTNNPTWEKPIRVETLFRQKVHVHINRVFDDDELNLLQALYKHNTKRFSPLSLSETDADIFTDCIINRQHLAPAVQETNASIELDFTMAYESKHYDVAEYPKLFQNWTINNLELVLEQSYYFNLGIVSFDVPKRIVIVTPEPSMSVFSSGSTSTTDPAILPTPVSNPPTMVKEEVTDLADDEREKSGPNRKAIVVSASVWAAMVIVGFVVYFAQVAMRGDK